MTFYFVYFVIQQHLTLIFIQAYFSVSPTSLIATSPTQSIVKFVKLDLTEGGHHYYILYFYISHLIGEIKWCFTIWFHLWAAWQMTNHPHMLTGFCNPLINLTLWQIYQHNFNVWWDLRKYPCHLVCMIHGNQSLPAKDKMTKRGPQNGWQGLPLGY